MDMPLHLLDALVPSAYTAAAAAYLLVFLREDAGAARWSRRLTWLAITLHLLVFLAPYWLTAKFALSAGSVLSGMGVAVAVVYLWLEGRMKTRAIGVFPIALSGLFAIVGSAAGFPTAPPPGDLPPVSTALHIACAIVGYAGLLLAALFGALYLVQRHALRARRFGLFWERLPSLELLDAFSSKSLLAGAAFLTVLIGVGHVLRRDVAPQESYFDAKIMATNLLWLGAVVVALGRSLHRLRPFASAVASLALFAFALGNMFVVDAFSRVHKDF